MIDKKYFREYQKKYYLDNPDKFKNIRENRKDYMKTYQEKNREKLRNYCKEYYEKNKESIKAHHKTDIGRACHKNSKSKRRAKYKNTDITAKWLRDLFENTTICEKCNRKIVKKSLDHIQPLNVGGLHSMSNVRIICLSCNHQRPRDGSDILQYRFLL